MACQKQDTRCHQDFVGDVKNIQGQGLGLLSQHSHLRKIFGEPSTLIQRASNSVAILNSNNIVSNLIGIGSWSETLNQTIVGIDETFKSCYACLNKLHRCQTHFSILL